MKRWPLAILYWDWWYSVVLALRGGAAYGLQSAHWVVTASAVLTSTLAIELYTLTPRQYSRNFADEILTCIFTPWPVKRPFVCPSVRPSVRPERRYRLNSLNKDCSYWPDYCLMHSTPGQYHGVDCYLKWPCSANFCVFHGNFQISMIGLDQVWGTMLLLSLWGFQLSAWNLVGWCSPWSRSLLKMAMLGQLCQVSRNFEISMIGFDHVWGMITARKSPYGLNFGGMMHCTMKWITVWNGHAQPMFAFSDLCRPRVLSSSERLAVWTARN